MRYIRPVGDSSTFKRYFYCILRAECYTRRFQRRDKPNCAKNATIYSILTKTVRYIRTVGDISTFKRHFYCILHAQCYSRRFQRRDKLNCVLNATVYTISKKTVHISVLLEIFRRLNAISIAFHMPSAMHAVFGVESSPTVRKMRPFTRF